MAISQKAAENAGHAKQTKRVTVRVDRLQLLVWPCGKHLPSIPPFVTQCDSFIRPQTKIRTYGRVRKLENHKTKTAIYIQYRPGCPWLAPAKITAIAAEGAGLCRSELACVAGSFKASRLLLVEISFDFAPSSKIDRDSTRAHGHFGKSHPRANSSYETLHYGGRESLKLVRAYPKPEVNAYRVELQLNSAFVRRHSIYELADLCRLPSMIFPSHILFVAINWKRLSSYLLGTKEAAAKVLLSETQKRGKALHQALLYLRAAGIRNTHRFLLPLSINHDVERALQLWGRQWKKEGK